MDCNNTSISRINYQIKNRVFLTSIDLKVRTSPLHSSGSLQGIFSKVQLINTSKLDIRLYQTNQLLYSSENYQGLWQNRVFRNQEILKIKENIPQTVIIIYEKRVKNEMNNKRIWTTEQDNFLRMQASLTPNRSWVKISEKLNEIFGGESRSPKQCRQRYINHAAPSSLNPFQNSWSSQNTMTLFQLYETHGPRWTTISQMMKNKSENIVKNKFYCSLRKFVRKLNKFLKSGENKYRKQIKYESIIRVMDVHDSYTQLPEHFKNWSCEIRKKILQLTLVTISDGQIQDQTLGWVSQNINKFNLQTRSYKPKKSYVEESPKPIVPTSSKSESWRNSSETDEQTDSKNRKLAQEKLIDQDIDEERKQDHTLIQPKRAYQQNSIYHKMLSQENLSQQELIKDFGTAADFRTGNKNNCGEDLYQEMFAEEFPRFQIDEFLL